MASGMHTRRGFLKLAAGASAAFAWASRGASAEWKPDWRAAFKTAGFDPVAAGNSVFVACGDVHEPAYSKHLPEQIAAWNAMRPRPRFVALLGDNVCNVSSGFGNTPDAKGLIRARSELDGLKAKLAELDKALPLKLVIGNHDTMPGEVDAAFFRTVFPGTKPYTLFEDSGIHFMIWNGGHDGAIDARQRTCIRREAAGLPKDATVVVFVHQPSLGMTERERGIPMMVREVFADHTGPLWLIAGHIHTNATSVFALPKTKIVQMAQTKSVEGYWIYGMTGGRIVARVYGAVGEGFRAEALPDLTRAAPEIPMPFAGRGDVLWSLLIGDDPAATRAAFVSGKGGNCGTWWFYVDDLVYRLPLAEKAPGATHFAVLGALCKHRKTGEPTRVFASGDGAAWVETPVLETKANVSRFVIPEALRVSRELFVQVRSFGYGADTCVGGFALCR